MAHSHLSKSLCFLKIANSTVDSRTGCASIPGPAIYNILLLIFCHANISMVIHALHMTQESSCQFMAKEWEQSTGKLSESLGNSVTRITKERVGNDLKCVRGS